MAEIAHYCRENALCSGIIIGIIGSIEKARINVVKELPAKSMPQELESPMEIVSGQGSVALMNGDTLLHVHLMVAKYIDQAVLTTSGHIHRYRLVAVLRQ